jgi:beta-lactamase regulating signal transducer with metallopeptidase domain
MTIASFIAMLNDRGVVDVFVAWVTWSLRGTALLALAWVATCVFRNGSAAVRHLVWSSALAGMLSIPLLARVVPPIHVAWQSSLGLIGHPDAGAAIEGRSAVLPGHPAARSAERIAVHARPLPAGPPSIRGLVFNIENSRTPTIGIGLLAAIAWLVVLALLMLRAIAGLLQLSRWARRAEVVHDAEWLSLTQRLVHEMRIGRPVTLLRSERACVPMTWGVVYPRILLPADADAWTAARRMVVLLHELAHIKRLDTLTQLLAQVSTALFWFHPAVWFAARQMRREREHACDDFVLDAGARASDYAHSLLQIARPLMSGSPAAAALAMARKSELEGRLLAILDPRIDRRPASRLRLTGASVALMSVAIPLAAITPSRAMPRPASLDVPSRPTTTALAIADTAIETQSSVARHATAIRTSSPAALPDSSSAAASIATVSASPSSSAPPDVPPPNIVPDRASWTRLNLVAPVAKRPPDVETLIAVTRAATKISSDHDKAEVLLSVARYYVPDNELRSAYFDAVLSMHNDFDRTRTLEPVLMKDTLPASASPQLVRIAAAMSSDNGRGSLVMHLANSHPALTSSMRSALISVSGALHSDFERARCITAIARRGNLSSDDAIRLIGVAKSMSGSTDKANALLSIAASRPLDTAELRRAYIAAAESISSPFDYRRAIIRVIE